MTKLYLSCLCLFLIILFFPKDACALTPPTNERALCYIEGKVLSHQMEESSDSFMNKIKVNTISLIILVASSVVKNDNGAFCARLAGIGPEEGQATDVFRLCDKTDAHDGQTITGIVGNPDGGGRYCIVDIQPYNANGSQ